ncbi:VOC family protein [Rhizobium rhizogenes]|nr:VOC family protein [Rhizobium rhizogenes]
MKIRQHLWFRRDMESAIELYTSLIPGSSIGWISNIVNAA